MNVLVDTDVVIEVTRGRDPLWARRWADLAGSSETILYSPVTMAEIWAGIWPKEVAPLEALFGSLICAPLDEQIGRQAGDFLRRYSKSHGLMIADALIAATAVYHDARLWTRNKKHYPMKEIAFY